LTQKELEEAIRFMVNCFDGSVAKDGSPTSLHSLGVLVRVSRAISCKCKKYYAACIAAVLHDVLEDIQGMKIQRICELSDHEVTAVVCLLTKVKGTKYRDYLDFLMNGTNLSYSLTHKIACLVKYHDMSDNLERTRWLVGDEASYLRNKYTTGLQLFEKDNFIGKITEEISSDKL
jgi:(p)ppGpp synthase/HD superfamily hydrolase